jgi:SAM-dependent methyltransferase
VQPCLFDRVTWRDPLTSRPLLPRVLLRNHVGLPMFGALQVEGSKTGYPIVGGVVRLSPTLARQHCSWLGEVGLSPPPSTDVGQSEETVSSFGFQWAWAGRMRSTEDLRWRVAGRFGLEPSEFAARLVLDAGAGAGDQSAYLLDQGAEVVSVDLSSAIDIVAGKLAGRPGWVGVQADVAKIPFASESFDTVYCEGVIQHTQNSAETVAELCRLVRLNGLVLATHYIRSPRLRGRAKEAYTRLLRSRLSRMDRDRLLLLTGCMAASAYLPLLGKAIRVTGTAPHSALMPGFRTTWINTFDMYGGHSFQRTVSQSEFQSYFDRVGGLDLLQAADGIIAARRRS